MGEIEAVLRQLTGVLEQHLALRVAAILVGTVVLAFLAEWLYRSIFRVVASRTSSSCART